MIVMYIMQNGTVQNVLLKTVALLVGRGS